MFTVRLQGQDRGPAAATYEQAHGHYIRLSLVPGEAELEIGPAQSHYECAW